MTKTKNTYVSRRIAVSTEFNDVFTHFYHAKNHTEGSISKSLLPSYQTILIFSFGAPATFCYQNKTEKTIDSHYLLGPIKKPINYTLQPGTELLIVNFKDGALQIFFEHAAVATGFPAVQLTRTQEQCFSTLWVALKNINTLAERVQHVQNYLRHHLKEQNLIAKKLVKFSDGNRNPIKVLASEQDKTKRSIQLFHKKYFGYSAKEIQRFKRFEKAIEISQNLLATSTKVNWFEIIVECGYFDQSQLIHDFNHYLGLTPTKYLKYQQQMCSSKS